MAIKKASEARLVRKTRIRRKISGTQERPRFSVYRGNRNLYVQIIDDMTGNTIASASSKNSEIKDKVKGFTVETAKAVGTLIAARAKEKGVEKVVFDRGGYRYHGKVKALADAAREGGLQF